MIKKYGSHICLHPIIPSTIVLLFFLGVITLMPFINTGITTRDDSKHQLYAHKPISEIAALAHDYATSQSRFYFFFSTWLIVLPYMVESVRMAKIIGMCFIGIDIALFSYILSKISKSWVVGILTALLFFVGLQNTSEHNMVNIYPFTFTFSFSLLLLSLMSYWNTLKKGKPYWAVIGVIAYSWAIMTYEIFIPYLLLFAVVGYLYCEEASWRKRIKACLKVLLPYICVLGIYFVLYFLYQFAHPTSYEGRMLAPFSLKNYALTIAQLDGSSFPLYYYFSTLYRPLVTTLSTSFEGDHWGPLFILTHMQARWVLRIVLLIGTVVLITKYYRPDRHRLKTLAFQMFLIGIVLFILPALIIGLTDKYQSLVLAGWSKSMPMTYFAYFGSVLLITSAILYGWWLFNSLPWFFKAGFLSILLIAVSLPTDFVNSYTTLQQNQTALKWDMVDQFIGTDIFRSIPQNSYIYAPSLFAYMNYSTYWQDYIFTKTGKKLIVSANIGDLSGHVNSLAANENENLYYLKYIQEDKNQSQYMVIAPIASNVIRNNSALICDKIYLLSQSKYRKFNVFIPFVSTESNRLVTVNDKVKLTNDSYFWAHIDKTAPGNSLVESLIQAHGMNPDLILLSYFNNPSVGDTAVPFPQNWTNGCYDREGNDVVNWHVCGPKATVIIQNKLSTPLTLELKTQFSTLSEKYSALVIDGAGVKDVLNINRAPLIYSKKVVLKPGDNPLTFTSDSENTDKIDPRDMRFAVINFALTPYAQ